MAEQANIQLIQSFYAAFTRGDLAAVSNIAADDVSSLVPGPQDVMSFVGQRQGRERFVRRFASFAEAQDAEKFEVRDFIAQGNKSGVYHS